MLVCAPLDCFVARCTRLDLLSCVLGADTLGSYSSLVCFRVKSARYQHKRSNGIIDSVTKEVDSSMLGTSRHESLAGLGLSASVARGSSASIDEWYHLASISRVIMPRLPALETRVDEDPALVPNNHAELEGDLGVALWE